MGFLAALTVGAIVSLIMNHWLAVLVTIGTLAVAFIGLGTVANLDPNRKFTSIPKPSKKTRLTEL